MSTKTKTEGDAKSVLNFNPAKYAVDNTAVQRDRKLIGEKTEMLKALEWWKEAQNQDANTWFLNGVKAAQQLETVKNQTDTVQAAGYRQLMTTIPSLTALTPSAAVQRGFKEHR